MYTLLDTALQGQYGSAEFRLSSPFRRKKVGLLRRAGRAGRGIVRTAVGRTGKGRLVRLGAIGLAAAPVLRYGVPVAKARSEALNRVSRMEKEGGIKFDPSVKQKAGQRATKKEWQKQQGRMKEDWNSFLHGKKRR